MQPLIKLLKKDFLLEIRRQYNFYGLLLYIVATVFVLYNLIDSPEQKIINALFWVVQLFICVNAVAKSFMQENQSRMLYYYSIVSPQIFIFGKLIYNSALSLVFTFLTIVMFKIFIGSASHNSWQVLAILFLGSWSLSLVYSFLAAIAAKAQHNSAIMAILGFPIVIPQLMLITKIIQLNSIPWFSVLLLVVLDILIIFLSLILFPYLWKE